MHTASDAPRRSAAGWAAASLLLFLAVALEAGCATAKRTPDVIWPPPPEKGRIKYLRSFRTPEELGLSAARKVLKALVPMDSRATIKEPMALALSPDERRLYVSSGRPARIIVVDLQESTMSLFAGGARQQPALIFGLATDADENVYVSDRKRGEVIVYGRDGNFLRSLGGDTLKMPTQIAIDRRAQLVYVMSGCGSRNLDHKVEVFSLKGDHLRTIGKRGQGPGEFNFPNGLAVAPDGKLWVADKLNFRVQVFDPSGALVDQFGTNGHGLPGAFDKIKGVGFDTFGNTYIPDTQQGVHILNPKHQPLMMFGAPPFIEIATSILVDRRNHIFVTDYGTNQVHEFQLVNTVAEDSYLKPEPAASAPAPMPASGETAPEASAPAPRPASGEAQH